MAIVGAGSIFLRSTNLTGKSTRNAELLFPGCVASFELSQQDQQAEAKCMIDGKRQVTAAAITESVASVKLSFEFADFNTLGFAYDELPSNSLNVPIPVLKTATVPVATPFEISDTDITAGTAPNITVYDATGKIFMLPVASTAVAGKFVASTGKLAFAAADAGKLVQYQVLKTYASMPTIGYENTADTFGTLEFNGTLFQAEGEKYGIQIFKLSRISTPQLTINGNIAQIDVEFRASVPAGRRRPFALFNLSKATVV